MKKRIVSLLLCLVMMASMAVVPAQAAYTPKYTDEAETLYELGLFKGTGTNADGTPIFSLQNKATRLQALIILIRLLGLEEDALATKEVNPFSDISNTSVGAKYAAYAYSTGLTNGIGGGKFGNGDVTPAQFTTFVLRALGYDDKAGDFKVSTAIQKGREIGLIESDMLTAGGNTLLRDECVKINYNALKTTMKSGDKTLAQKLIEDGVLTEKDVQNSGLLFTIVHVPYDAKTRTVKREDYYKAFPDAVRVDCSTYVTENALEKFKQIDYSPLAILLRVPDIRDYCGGITNSLPKRTPYKEGTDFVYGGPNTIFSIVAVDKDSHLIGYCIIPPGTNYTDSLPFVSCHVDGSEEIERVRKENADAVRNLAKVAPSAFTREDVTDTTKTFAATTCYLRVDESKLPAAAKGAKYYATARIDGNSDSAIVQNAMHTIKHDLMSTTKDYGPVYTFDQPGRGGIVGSDGAVVFLYNASREIVGYSIIKENELKITETLLGENGEVLNSSDTRDYFAIQDAALKANGTAALADAKCYGLGDDFGWIDSPKSDADYINNTLYSFLVGNYSLNFAFPSATEFARFKAAVLDNFRNLCNSYPEIMGAYCNQIISYQSSVNQKGNYLCQLVIENPSLTEKQLYAQQLEAVKAVKALYTQMHSSGKITDTMTEKQISQVYYNYFKSQNIKASDLPWDTKDRGEVMKYDTLYSCMVAKKSDCLGRTGAFNMMMHMEGIYAVGLHCHPIGEPEGANHCLTYLMLDGAEYISDWGNNMSTRTIDEARAKYDFFEESLQYAREGR